MRISFEPSLARGRVTAPPSKSLSHRALIAAGLSQGKSRLYPLEASQDILATLDCLQALGVRWQWEGEGLTMEGAPIHKIVDRRVFSCDKRLEMGGSSCQEGPLSFPCRESGSTFRFMVPLALAAGLPALFSGSPRLMERPQEVYLDLAREKGFTFNPVSQSSGRKQYFVQGPLLPGSYRISGRASSQFASGLLFALPLLDGDSGLEILPPVNSRPYIDLTLSVLRDFGLKVEEGPAHFFSLPGRQSYRARDYRIEGDYSNAAFLDALNLLGGQVEVGGLSPQTAQGDRLYLSYFHLLQQGPADISLKDCPDLGPVLFALAAALHGGHFSHTGRLAIKESNRLTAMAEELEKMGGRMEIGGDEVYIPKASLHRPPSPLQGHNDHRIVMALSLLLSRTGGSIEGAEAVNKSFPAFFSRLRELGVQWKEEG